MFGAVLAAEPSAALVDVAREFSPRLEIVDAGGDARSGGPPREIVMDLSGLARLFGDARTIADELRRTAAERGLRVRVAIAGTRTAARLLVHHRAGVTVIEPGTEAPSLAPLPIDLLPVVAVPAAPAASPPRAGACDLPTLRRWGLRTLGDLAALPDDEVAARLGQPGVAWQRLARGEDPAPLVPAVPEERFEQALDLDWPIEGLEPLSFVLGRLMEPLTAHLAARDRGAAVLHIRLQLVTKTTHVRTLELPTPIRDARTLRTLALLDLESHPPAAAIDRVEVAVDPTPARVVQFSLLTRPLPAPEQISTLLARLNAVMGEGRVGAPAEVDSWHPGAFAMKPFSPQERQPPPVPPPSAPLPAPALRRFRFPVAARVRVDAHKPAHVTTDRRGLACGRVEQCAGPWRTSGAWWMEAPARGTAGGPPRPPSPHSPHCAPWDRDEWDVTVSDGGTYRLFYERGTDQWFIDGVVD